MTLADVSILIVSDAPASIEPLTGRLQQLKYACTCSDSRQAVEMTLKSSFDLILLDATLPEKTFGDLLERIRADVSLKHVSVIVVSDDAALVERGLALGGNDYLLGTETETLLKARLDVNLEPARLREALKAANAETSRFVSQVSHEIKTPMTSIKGYSDLLLTTAAADLGSTQLEFLQVIRDNIGQMGRLVSDLTDIVKAEAGTLYLEPEPVSVTMAVESALEPFLGAIKANRQTLDVDIPADLPPVKAEWGRVVQIVSALVDNACRHTPPEGKIAVSAELMGEMIRFSVRDTGSGIAAEHLPRVFDRFFRYKSKADARKRSGPGLGLSLAKSLIEVQGGQIRLKSEADSGTTVSFTLPVYTK